MRATLSVLIIIVAGLAAGCVEREMTITSNPPGALALVSNVEVGRTPVTIAFTWYGDYDIILRAEGYKTLKTHAKIIMPIYEIPPLDLLSAVVPWTYHDQRYLHFEMEPFVKLSDDVLIERALQMELRTAEGKQATPQE